MIKRKRKNPRDNELLENITFEKIFAGNNIQYIIKAFNKNIGYAIYNISDEVVMNIVIKPEFQKRGVGTYLYDFIEQDQNIILKPSNTVQGGKLLAGGQKLWEKRLKKNPDSELEQFRINSIEELIEDSSYLGKIIKRNLKSSRFEIFIVGSVLNPNKFNENSDIDVAILVYDKRKATGLDEENTDKFQKIFSKIPFSFGVVDISVHNNELRINGNKMKIYEAT